jgi:hypothetical protein
MCHQPAYDCVPKRTCSLFSSSFFGDGPSTLLPARLTFLCLQQEQLSEGDIAAALEKAIAIGHINLVLALAQCRNSEKWCVCYLLILSHNCVCCPLTITSCLCSIIGAYIFPFALLSTLLLPRLAVLLCFIPQQSETIFCIFFFRRENKERYVEEVMRAQDVFETFKSSANKNARKRTGPIVITSRGAWDSFN